MSQEHTGEQLRASICAEELKRRSRIGSTVLVCHQRDEYRNWLVPKVGSRLPIALTLTLKQSLRIDTDSGSAFHVLQAADVEAVAKRFQQKLNRAVFGRRRADRRGETLSYFVVREGDGERKHHHLHLAVGGFPRGTDFWTVRRNVRAAVANVRWLNEQYCVAPANEDWINYMTKEIGRHDSANVLLGVSNFKP